MVPVQRGLWGIVLPHLLPGDLVEFEVGAAFILNKQQRHFLFARRRDGEFPGVKLLLGPALDDEDIG